MYYVWNDEMSRVTYALLSLCSRDAIGTELKEPGDVAVPLGDNLTPDCLQGPDDDKQTVAETLIPESLRNE